MDSLLKLTNQPFQIEFNGKEYVVKKATLQQVARYFGQMQSLSKEEGNDIEKGAKGIAYALYLILSPVDNTITEDYIIENLPNVNPNELLTTLGFLVPAPEKPIVQ